ncbi:MAG: hypothetical protein HQM08_11650 [Candidatus Riflebacteria bacterium]|nr:hypothetical protein [Candidatus Riflebacteria bacterium]
MLTKEELFSIFSDGSSDFISPPGPHALGDSVSIALRMLPQLEIIDVKLRIFPDGEERLLPMKNERRGKFAYWFAETKLNCSPFPYRFRIQTLERVYWLNASGLHPYIPTDDEDFKLVPGFSGPGWVLESVFYQIFPDRFRCGRPEIAKAPRSSSPAFKPPTIKAWDDPLGIPNLGNEFYGGDLWGVREMLPHLEMLGINAIYMTPIFEAYSNHRYDTVDYRRVDHYLGGNEALSALNVALENLGMRYVLDGVFNHSGVNHFWFQDACKNPESKFQDWYTFTDYPEKYVSWLDHKSLPKLDYSSEELRDEIFRGSDAIAKTWLRDPYSASGWRLDAPNMLGCNGTDRGNIDLWREFRKEIKTENPEAYIFGECFFEGTKWLQGDAFDAVMNYKGFTLPFNQWLSGKDLHLNPGSLSAEEAATWINSIIARVPFALRNLQFNALSTHDIPRFISKVEMNEQLYRLGLIFQMAFPGVPSIYYGEELALAGGKDPYNRSPMPWGKIAENRDLLEFVAALCGMRRSLSILQTGAFRIIAAVDDLLAFTRFDKDEVLIIAGNRSSKTQSLNIPVEWLGLNEGQGFRSVFSIGSVHFVENGHIKLFLSPFEGIWLSAKLDEN